MQIIKITNDNQNVTRNTKCVSKVILNSDTEHDMIEYETAGDCHDGENMHDKRNLSFGTLRNSFIQRSKSAVTNTREKGEVRSGISIT